jgi:triacylglycerol esterase/lipase EstA (alpha/beta hydrolase family)
MERSSVPLLTFSVEATAAGATLAFRRLADFATVHDIAPAVRERATAVAADVVNALAAALSGTARLQIDADIGERDLQLVVAHGADDAGLALMGVRGRLERIGSCCDGFAAERPGAPGIEVWCRFILR